MTHRLTCVSRIFHTAWKTAKQLSYSLFFRGRTHICITVLSNFMISFQVKLYNYNGDSRVLSFNSFPLHVGIVSLSCCSVPP